MANPTAVTRPTRLPPFSYASGIIESVSIAMTAPPAKACTNAMTSGDAFPNTAYPANDANADATTTIVQMRVMWAPVHPDSTRSRVPASPSGRLDNRIAMRTVSPIPSPPMRVRPRTIDS